MNIVLLGFGIGLLSLLPPGPVTLTLVQVGARQGHRPAMRGALGVVGGDSLLGMVSVAIVALGATMPSALFSATQLTAALLLTLIGGALILRPSAAADAVDRITRPGRALFLLTSLTPTALGAWIALLAAMPFADDRTQLSLFALGVILSSSLWHPVLATLASTMGARLNDEGHQRLSKLGGLMMGVLGMGLFLSQWP